jgi:hypothetical protein
MTPDWPITTDPVATTFKQSLLNDDTIKNKADGGYTTTRARNTRRPKRFTFSLHLTIAEADILDAFEDNDTAGTAGSFYWRSAKEYNSPSKYWLGTHAYKLGDVIRPVTNNGHSYKCVVAGTTNVGAPSWVTTRNGLVTEGGASAVVWKENTYEVRFGSNIEFKTCENQDFSDVDIVLEEV